MIETVSPPAGLRTRLQARQRAMLAEMGVRLWWPEAPADNALPAQAEDQAAQSSHRAQPAMASDEGAVGRLAAAAGAGSAAPAPEASVPAETALQRRTAQFAGHAEPAPATTGRALPAKAPADWAGLRALAGQYQPRILQPGELARWLFVLDPPGGAGLSAAQSAQGDAQRLLMNMAAAVRLQPEQVHAIHALQHVPAPGHDAGEAALAQRMAWLLPEIVRIQPQVVLCMGRHAAFSVLGDGAPLGQLRGQPQRMPLPAVQDAQDATAADAAAFAALAQIPVVVTYAPAYLLRNPAVKRQAWQDLCLAHALVKASAQASVQ